MDWSPIDTKWKPLPEERDRFHDVYIDESSTNHRFLVIGGLALPYSHALQFEQDIVHARSISNQSTVDSHGQTREMKWE